MKTLAGRFKDAEGRQRTLLSCRCGGWYWTDSPQEVMRKHAGHKCDGAQRCSWWVAFKVWMGWVR